MREMADEMASSLRLVLSVIVPFAAAMLVLGPALATVLFGYGAGRRRHPDARPHDHARSLPGW